jgi:hypothetical protein
MHLTTEAGAGTGTRPYDPIGCPQNNKSAGLMSGAS